MASVSIYTLVKIRCSGVAFEKGLLVYPYGYNTDILAVRFRSMDRPESPNKREAGRSIFFVNVFSAPVFLTEALLYFQIQKKIV